MLNMLKGLVEDNEENRKHRKELNRTRVEKYNIWNDKFTEGWGSRLYTAEEKTSELKDTAIETISL